MSRRIPDAASPPGAAGRAPGEPRDPRLVVTALGSRGLRGATAAAAPGGDWAASLEAWLQPLTEVIAAGFRLVVTHGGRRELDEALHRMTLTEGAVPTLPLDRCVAAAQGSLGYAIQQALENGCRARGLDTPVVAVLTRVLVDGGDPAFDRPGAGIGPPYPVARARRLGRARGFAVVEDAGLGRRAVAQPVPLEILEIPVLRGLVAAGAVPVACGLGGVAVARGPAGLRGVEAIVDADLASAVLASALGADRLVLLTGVARVEVGFGTPRAIGIERLSAVEARALTAAGEFPPSSMGPKIEAGLRFVEAGGREAVITAPAHLRAALAGEAGTRLLA